MLWLGIEPGAADGSTELFINPGIKPRMALIKISFIAPAPLNVWLIWLTYIAV